MSGLDFAVGAARAANGKKALRVVLQDVQGLSDVCDYQLICSGSNEKQTQAICQGVEDYARVNFSQRAITIEGKQTGNWILLDFGSLVVHVFNDEIRDFYALDQLWPRAKAVTY